MNGLPVGWRRRLTDGFVLRKADAVVALSNAERDFLARRRGLPPDRIAVIPNGISTAVFDRIAALSKAGFTTVRTTPYLSARMCELWDRVDGPLCMGAGPLTLGRAYRFGMRFLPTPLRTKLNRQWQHYFMRALHENPPETPCAMLIQAGVPSGPGA
jgi:hypothetical protein